MKDDEVKKVSEKLRNINYQINEINDKRNGDTKEFLDKSLELMEVCLKTLKNLLFMATFDLAQVVIDTHNDVLMKKKELLDTYLKETLSNKGTVIDFNNWDTVNAKLKEQNIIAQNNNVGVTIGVNKGLTTDMNTDTNYVLDLKNTITTTTSGIFITYKAIYITYKFNDRIEIYKREYDNLNNNKIVVDEKKIGSKSLKIYNYNGDLDYLKYVSGFLMDELEKEELDLEEEINKYGLENIPKYKEKIDYLNDLLDKEYVKKLKKDEQYRTPKLSDAEKEGYKRIGKEAPKENVLVTEITVLGYRDRLLTNKKNIDIIVEEIKKLEQGINKFKDTIKNSKVTGNPVNMNDNSDPDVQKIKELEEEKKKTEEELAKLSPQEVGNNKLILLLLQIMLFPILILLGLLSDMFGGIIDFITGLPLLKFDKIISFFTDLFQLPSKEGLTKRITETIQKVATVEDSAIESVTSIVDGASSSVSDITTKYIDDGLMKDLPFEVSRYEAPEELMAAEGPVSTRYNAEDEKIDYSTFDDENVGPSTLSQGNGGNAYKSKSLDSLHPSIRQYSIETFNELNTILKRKYKSWIQINLVYRNTEYQKILYDRWQSGDPSIPLAAPPGSSYHEVGLAVDLNVFDKGRVVKSDTATNEVFQYSVYYLKSRGWKWYGPKDYIHWDYRNLTSKKPAELLKSGKTIKDENGISYPYI